MQVLHGDGRRAALPDTSPPPQPSWRRTFLRDWPKLTERASET